ncbi:NADPH:quinone oxidoreductase [Pseudonocardia sulfidoxydans NBRC 16205]|uniref:NADPH:quinone oxidoreductase n=1 Tax=Pseudonocardia sulfidoxydans NBRC 16205 TaxID=1223511 RepID=A0A511DJA9_9PSEU|nr:NADPH:quinone reductase [Pseudonocardia sulfidoxydans]GEL24891.1 NADPH:quinone oxidoreductase [Pseudonocardia sulfidoxydans NBRC 16205]
MRAAWYDRPGPARDVLVVGELPDPAPGAGEALVRVAASGVNPSDHKRRSSVAPTRRCVPHSDGAGTVVATGDGVERDWIGRRVWLWNAVNRHGYGVSEPGESGTAAELVAIPVDHLAALPDTVGFDVGACLGVPAFTAYAAVLGDGPVDGATILVQGGAGSVGEVAVQLAVQAGATVLATVSSPSKAERARAAGAHHVIDYRTTDVRTAVRDHAPGGVDRVVEVDFAANVHTDTEVLAPYGTIASYSSTSNPEPVVPYFALQLKGATLRTIQVFTMPADQRARAVGHIGTALAAGTLVPSIAAVFGLDDIAAAHEAAENRPEGNVIVEPGMRG